MNQTLIRQHPHYQFTVYKDGKPVPILNDIKVHNPLLDAISVLAKDKHDFCWDASSSAGAIKFDQDKAPLNLLSTEALTQIAKVMQFGAQKYESHNWRKGFAWSRPLAAAMRHISSFNDGEDKDPESGLSHLAHAACCIMFLLEFERTHKHLDDRYKVPENV